MNKFSKTAILQFTDNILSYFILKMKKIFSLAQTKHDACEMFKFYFMILGSVVAEI